MRVCIYQARHNTWFQSHLTENACRFGKYFASILFLVRDQINV